MAFGTRRWPLVAKGYPAKTTVSRPQVGETWRELYWDLWTIKSIDLVKGREWATMTSAEFSHERRVPLDWLMDPTVWRREMESEMA